MNYKYRTLWIVVCFALPLFAQEKVKPPPTRMPVPSDSLQQPATQYPSRVRSEKSELELPEVLIQGRTQVVRIASDKETTVPDTPALVKPENPSQVISTWFQLQDTKPQVETSGPGIQRSTWGDLLGGSYATFMANAGHWQEFGSFSVHARGWLDRSAGQYRNSQYTTGGLTLQTDYHFTDRVTGTIRGDYTLTRRGLFQVEAVSPAETRTGSSGGANAGFQFDIADNSTLQLGVDYGATRFRSDTGETALDRTTDTWYGASGEFITQLAGIQLGGSGRILMETLSRHQNDVEREGQFGEVGLETLFPVSGAVSAGLGAKYQSVRTDTSTGRIAPYGRVNFIPGNRMGVSATISTGYEYQTFTRRRNQNPYIAHVIPLQPEEADWRADISMDIRLSQGVSLHAGIAYARMKTLYYWHRDPQTGFFDLEDTGEVQVAETRGGVEWTPTDWLELRGTMVTYSATYPEGAAYSDVYYIPYRARMRIPLQATLRLPSDFELTLDGELSGPRSVDYTTNTELAAYNLVNATISRSFQEKVTVLLSASNILNESYTYWEQYPRMGIQIFLGVRAKL